MTSTAVVRRRIGVWAAVAAAALGALVALGGLAAPATASAAGRTSAQADEPFSFD